MVEGMDKPLDNTIDQSSMDKGINRAKNLGRDAKNMVSDVASRISQQIPADWDQKFETLRQQSQMYMDRTESMVRRYPFYSILGAAAVGAIVASLLSGSKSEKVYRIE